MSREIQRSITGDPKAKGLERVLNRDRDCLGTNRGED